MHTTYVNNFKSLSKKTLFMHAFMYVCLYVCICVCMCVGMHACMYVCVYTLFKPDLYLI